MTVLPEDVRMSYQCAVQLVTYDGQLSWRVSGIFLQFAFLMIAGAVFPSFIGSDSRLVLGVVGMFVAAAGFTMTLMFGSMVRRIRAYEEYWVSCAAHFESLMSSPIQTVGGAHLFSVNKTIHISDKVIHMPKVAAIKSKVMLDALFASFLITFAVLFVVNVYKLCLPAWLLRIWS